MAQLAIKGHATRGKEVIEILTMLGGKTHTTLCGNLIFRGYYIGLDGFIDYKYHSVFSNSILYSLEEFLKKFPYRVGDRVKVCGDNLGIVIGMRWESGYVVYKVKLSKNGYETSKTSENLQPYKEETMDKVSKAVFDANAQCCDITNRLIKEETMEEQSEQITVDIPNGYEFFSIDDNNKIVLTKKQLQYPKTYEECCKIIDYHLKGITIIGYKTSLLENFQQLLICRDAYWKIAGEEMGLGKPWKPDWTNVNERKYCIVNIMGKMEKWVQKTTNKIFAFPTAEMHDVFLENFKELIELCKELL